MAKKKRAPFVKKMDVNRNYKDTVFRMLFSDRKNLLSLYNAVSGAHYDDPEKLEIVTLENAIYMGMKNDIAFVLETNLYLYEHQSTMNPNIPLRNLLYISAEYQKMVAGRSLYSSAVIKIPAPKFFVFYNGTAKTEDQFDYKLSDMYEKFEEKPDLELKVTVLNINDGYNRELMEHCRLLSDYSKYVSMVRNYASKMQIEEAVECAVKECIEKGILSDFLLQNRAEVIRMSIFEYDKEKEEKKLRKAEFEAGMEQGIAKGIEEERLNSIRNMIDIGISKEIILGRYSREEYEKAVNH